MQNKEPDTEEKKEEYSFIKETIKDDSSGGKKEFKYFAKLALRGIVFGLFACIGFCAFKPWVDNQMDSKAEAITIEKDDNLEEDVGAEATDESAAVLTADSYKEIMNSMYEEVQKVDKSIVSIHKKEEQGNADASEQDVVTEQKSTGIIVGDNGKEILILADAQIGGKDDTMIVSFVNKTEYEAVLKKKDRNRNIAIYSVEKKKLSEDTRASIKVAALGNSNLLSRGDIVIALGNIFGYDRGVGYGIVSSTEQKLDLPDGQCSIIATDIALAADGTGVLANQKGEIVGWVRSQLGAGEKEYTGNAIALSDLKPELEMMLNGESIPYIGICGTVITEEISKEQDMPRGIYVTKVAEDSPAMKAGVQIGDVIYVINDTEITSNVGFESTILNSTPDTEMKIKVKRRGADKYVDVTCTVKVETLE